MRISASLGCGFFSSKFTAANTIPGVQIPYPYGGRQRQVMVDIDPEKVRKVNAGEPPVDEPLLAETMAALPNVARVFERSDADVRALEGLPAQSGWLRGAR